MPFVGPRFQSGHLVPIPNGGHASRARAISFFLNFSGRSGVYSFPPLTPSPFFSLQDPLRIFPETGLQFDVPRTWFPALIRKIIEPPPLQTGIEFQPREYRSKGSRVFFLILPLCIYLSDSNRLCSVYAGLFGVLFAFFLNPSAFLSGELVSLNLLYEPSDPHV